MNRGTAHGVNTDGGNCGEETNYDDPKDGTQTTHDETQAECDKAVAEVSNIPDRPHIAELPGMNKVPNLAKWPRMAEVPNLADRPRMAEVPTDRPSSAELPNLVDRPSLAELPNLSDRPSLAELPNLADRLSLAELPNLADRPSLSERPNLADRHQMAEVSNLPDLPNIVDQPSKAGLRNLSGLLYIADHPHIADEQNISELPNTVELPNIDGQPFLAELPYINKAEHEIEQEFEVRKALVEMSAKCNTVYSETDLKINEEAPEHTDTTLLLHCGEAEVKINDDKTKDDIEESKTNKDVEIVFEEESNVPDGGWGWFIILGALLLRLIIGGLGRSHGLFYIRFIDRYGGTATATALVTSLTSLFRVGFGPLVSVLCTRFPCRLLTLVGACLLVTGLILTGFAPSLPFLYISYGAICGLGRAFALTPVPILLGYYFNKRRSLAFGLASAGFSLGGFGITPVVEILFQTYGLQGTFLLLGGFALNVLVCAALFRPIELHRKLTRNRSKTQSILERRERLIVKSIEDIQSGQVLNTSTISIEAIQLTKRSDSAISDAYNHDDREVRSDLNVTTSNGYSCCNGDSNIDSDKRGNENKLKHAGKTENIETPKKNKKKQLIAWSILKDVRFLCYCFSNFLLTLPSSGLFLPALAKAKGASDIQAAALLSINAGSDTVIRVISGLVLDMRIFRQIRPQIYSAVIVIQGLITLMYPLMSSYSAFVMLCVADGVFTGLKAAQNSVVVMDILGVDKLASSMAITMSVQAVAIIIGPTVSGRLKDISGVYDGAFYFGGTAVVLAGLVMTGGNVRKYIMDKRKARQQTAEEQSLTNMA